MPKKKIISLVFEYFSFKFETTHNEPNSYLNYVGSVTK
jgi:hypothetical protein